MPMPLIVKNAVSWDVNPCDFLGRFLLCIGTIYQIHCFTYQEMAVNIVKTHSLVENSVILHYIKPYFVTILLRWKFISVHLDLFE